MPVRPSQAAVPPHPTSDRAAVTHPGTAPLCPSDTRARGWSPGGPGAALSYPRLSHTAAVCSSAEFLGGGTVGTRGTGCRWPARLCSQPKCLPTRAPYQPSLAATHLLVPVAGGPHFLRATAPTVCYVLVDTPPHISQVGDSLFATSQTTSMLLPGCRTSIVCQWPDPLPTSLK